MNTKRNFLIIALLLLIVGFGIYLYSKSNLGIPKSQATILNTQKSKTISAKLIVTPQTPNGKVVVDSAILSKQGYVVVREIQGDRLSQIVEISKPLSPGTHKNITISFGNADETNKDLIVMIYDDYKSDSIFNDFDQPAIDKNGNMTAVYVKTGKPLPTTITETDSSGMQGMNMSGMKVSYTDKGFLPQQIKIPVGSMVEFVNNSSKDMWVASNPHPAHTDLPTFDQFKQYKSGSIYRYVFDKKGTWGFHDHLNPNAGGVVTVN